MIGTGERAYGEAERKERERTRKKYVCVCVCKGRGVGTRERYAEDAEGQEGGAGWTGGRTEEVGWPKVARVEYWNALPEAISVRCPPFALLSCSTPSIFLLPVPLSFSLPLCRSVYLSLRPSVLVASPFFCAGVISSSFSFSLFLGRSFSPRYVYTLSLSPSACLSRATQHLSPRAQTRAIHGH